MDLLRSLNQEFEISAFALKPFGPVWHVKSAKGFFALKRTGSPGEKLVRLFKTLSEIKGAGFHSLILPEISKANLPYLKCNNQYYQLFKWCQGNHPSFRNPSLIPKFAGLFGSLHRISRSVMKPEEGENMDLVANLRQRTAFLEKTIAFLKNERRLNRIDRSILSWSDYFLNQARYSLSGLVNMKQALISDLPVGFCHNDPAPGNIIIENDQCFLIDFDLSACGLLVMEVAKLTGRVLQANNWQPTAFNLVIDAYSRERTISDWERTVLPYLLCFPQHFWRISSQRWEEKLKWSERRFAARFWEITNAERQRLFFLKSQLPQLPISERLKVAIPVTT